jgi:hypothetical protein
MSENNYGNPQGNAQNPYAAQQPASSQQNDAYGQSSYNQSSYGQDSSAQGSYGQNSYGQNSYGQNSYNQSSYGQESQNQFGQYGQDSSAQQSSQYGQGYPQQGQPGEYNNYQYQQNSYQQPGQDLYNYGQQGNYPYQASKKTPALAITSMILGIVGLLTGFFAIGLLFGIAAVVLGIISLKQTKAAGAGQGFAITGIITGALAFIFGLIMVFVYILTFQTMQKCAEVGTSDGHGHVVCQIGDDPDDLMTVPAR